jgi:hypothetical protein
LGGKSSFEFQVSSFKLVEKLTAEDAEVRRGIERLSVATKGAGTPANHWNSLVQNKGNLEHLRENALTPQGG